MSDKDLFRIMLVEDEEDFSSLVKIHLERINDKLQISTFTNASQAIEALRNQQFNVIVSDYHMPDIDGLSFLANIRKLNISTPFILFTGVDQEELEDKAFNIDFSLILGCGVGSCDCGGIG